MTDPANFRVVGYSEVVVVSDVGYGPFGETYGGTGNIPIYTFTGMDENTVTILYDFPAREYGIQGRWPSPDPAGLFAANPFDPQSWNQYAYVSNNPLALVDPFGLDDCPPDAPPHAICGSGYPPPPKGPGSGGVGGPGRGGPCALDVSWRPHPAIPNCGWGPSGAGGTSVNKTYSTTTDCKTDAAGLMQQVESNFSQFADYTGNFGLLGVPTSTAAVSFGPVPVTAGATIPITNINLTQNPFGNPMGSPFVTSFNVSVTVSSVSSTNFTFATNPGHVLYPAQITFSASNAGNGQINFSIQVNGNFANLGSRLGYYFGGSNLENNIWNNVLHNVRTVCTAPPPATGTE